ncbi:hypothetical protein HDK77DRAFT_25864 [Phyllosticta capitalensis]
MCGLRMPIQQAARGIAFDTDGHPPILLHHCRFIFLTSLRPTAWLREVLVAEPAGLPGRLLHARPAWLIMAEAVFCGLQRARACTMYRQFMYRRLGSLWVYATTRLCLQCLSACSMTGKENIMSIHLMADIARSCTSSAPASACVHRQQRSPCWIIIALLRHPCAKCRWRQFQETSFPRAVHGQFLVHVVRRIRASGKPICFAP